MSDNTTTPQLQDEVTNHQFAFDESISGPILSRRKCLHEDTITWRSIRTWMMQHPDDITFEVRYHQADFICTGCLMKQMNVIVTSAEREELICHRIPYSLSARLKIMFAFQKPQGGAA